MSDSLGRLYQAVLAAKDLDPATSRTARLFQRGPAKMAKKLAEEAIEVVIDAVNGNSDAVVREVPIFSIISPFCGLRRVCGPRTCGAKWSGANICSESPRSCRNPPSKCPRFRRRGPPGDQLSRLRAVTCVSATKNS